MRSRKNQVLQFLKWPLDSGFVTKIHLFKQIFWLLLEVKFVHFYNIVYFDCQVAKLNKPLSLLTIPTVPLLFRSGGWSGLQSTWHSYFGLHFYGSGVIGPQPAGTSLCNTWYRETCYCQSSFHASQMCLTVCLSRQLEGEMSQLDF